MVKAVVQSAAGHGFLLWEAILATLQLTAGAALLADFVGPQWAGAAALVVGALQGGTAVYKKGLVTPVPGTSDGE